MVGIDIAKDKHVARTQDDRGMEFGKRLIFENRIHGFQQLLERVTKIQKEQGETNVIFGVEPTGHYWLGLAYFKTAKGYTLTIGKHGGVCFAGMQFRKVQRTNQDKQRGRKKLRKALYLAVRPLVALNPTFKALHAYYTTRPNRPLKKQQLLIALCCKLLCVLFVIGQKHCEFDGRKLLKGLPQARINTSCLSLMNESGHE